MTLTDYELERQRRVEENRRRMEQLGLPRVRALSRAENSAVAFETGAPSVGESL